MNVTSKASQRGVIVVGAPYVVSCEVKEVASPHWEVSPKFQVWKDETNLSINETTRSKCLQTQPVIHH